MWVDAGSDRSSLNLDLTLNREKAISPPLFSHAIGDTNMQLWVAKGFILPSLSFFVYLSFTHPLFACGVMRRHRGHTEARWEGHYDLCVLLLSRLLWRTEGELLLLHDHINAKLQNTNSRVSISQIKDQRCKAVISHASSNHQCASIEISANKILPVAGAVFIRSWKNIYGSVPWWKLCIKQYQMLPDNSLNFHRVFPKEINFVVWGLHS